MDAAFWISILVAIPVFVLLVKLLVYLDRRRERIAEEEAAQMKAREMEWEYERKWLSEHSDSDEPLVDTSPVE